VEARTLEAFNPITGPVVFVTLALPEPWRITRATVTPDVQTTIRQGDRQWVASGETRHVVFDRARRLRGELVVRITSGRPRRMSAPLAEAAAAGSMTAGGHVAQFQYGRRREGIVFRRLVPAGRVQHYCDQTKRTILVELSGSLDEGELRALVDSLGDLECHVPAGGVSP